MIWTKIEASKMRILLIYEVKIRLELFGLIDTIYVCVFDNL